MWLHFAVQCNRLIELWQTVRLWDPMTGEAKSELRGHTNDVLVVAFAPIAAYGAIRELAGIPVRLLIYSGIQSHI